MLIEEETVDASGEQISVTETESETPPAAQPVDYEIPEEQIGADAGGVRGMKDAVSRLQSALYQ